MKSFIKTAVVALAAAAGISSAAAEKPKAVDSPKAPQVSGATGLSFEDLRISPLGKVAVEIELTKAPRQRHADNCAPGPKP